MLTIDALRHVKQLQQQVDDLQSRLQVVEEKLSPQIPVMWTDFWPAAKMTIAPSAQIIPFKNDNVQDS